jgi:hypothetical protein
MDRGTCAGTSGSASMTMKKIDSEKIVVHFKDGSTYAIYSGHIKAKSGMEQVVLGLAYITIETYARINMKGTKP